jgi:hypothetical protein
MNKTLAIECEQVVCTSPVKRGEDNPHIKMTLEDVRIFELMASLIKEVGVETILDHISDTEIKNYLEGTK